MKQGETVKRYTDENSVADGPGLDLHIIQSRHKNVHKSEFLDLGAAPAPQPPRIWRLQPPKLSRCGGLEGRNLPKKRKTDAEAQEPKPKNFMFWDHKKTKY